MEKDYNLSELFLKKAREIATTSINEKYICRDSCIGSYEGGNFIPKHSDSDDRKQRLFGDKINIQNEINVFRIVLVLESPHVEEFLQTPYLPAQGETGVNIKGYLDNLLYQIREDIDSKKKYEIYLVNSLQYQCSLGQKTEVYRDEIWNALWEKKIFVDDFVKRLNKLNPNILINLCTDSSKNGRREKVQKIILSRYAVKKDIVSFTGSHPSSWNKNKNRYIVKTGIKDKIYF